MADRPEPGGRRLPVVADDASDRRRGTAAKWRVLQAIGFGRCLGIVLLTALLVVRVWNPAPVETLLLRTFDLYQLIQPRQADSQPVVAVDIDEESLAAFGQWPWPRTLVADLIRRIHGGGGAVIGFDSVFPEPDRLSPATLADSLTGIDEPLRAQLRALPGTDDALARVLRESRVVLGQSGYQRRLPNSGRPLAEVPMASVGGDPRPFLPEFPGIVRNIPILEDAAAGRAMFTLLPERDGIVRRVPALINVEGTVIPTLVLEMLRVATGQGPFLVRSDSAGVRSIAVAGIEIPTDRNGRIWVNYARNDPDTYVSAKDVLAGAVAPGALAGKLVLVGSSATGLFDVKSTPLDAAMPGMAIHAQLLETILSKSYLLRPHYALGAELMLTTAIGLLMIVLVPILGAFTALLLGGGLAAALIAGSWALYAREGVLLDVAYTLVAGLAIYVFLIFINYFREEARRRQVRGAFSQYLSPALVEQLAREPDRLVLGGERKQMTVLFCDARGFTMISELFRADPQGLTRLMNRFLTPLTQAVLDHNGTIDKYMGDAVMAFWNAPLDDARHAEHGCAAALAMLSGLRRLNEVRIQEAAAADQPYLPLRVGIGINTGACVVGNLGSDLRFDYSVLGDPVNLASRLEGQSSRYGVPILVGTSTAEGAAGKFAFLEIDTVRVKGKAEPERVFALLGDAALAADPAFGALAARTDEALACYRDRDWDGAERALTAARAQDQAFDLDEFFQVYEARIAAFRENPPGPDWGGIHEATTK